jgi:hypothetical protein
MSLDWFELRVAGSPGTVMGGRGGTEGISVSEAGRLCTISSGLAMRFATEQDALDYLVRRTMPGRYRFEAVLCHIATSRAARPAMAGAAPRAGS